MAELDTADRKRLGRRQFALVDREGTGHLPINDEEHVRNAISRWNQTDFPSILAAARRHGIEVSDEDSVVKSRST